SVDEFCGACLEYTLSTPNFWKRMRSRDLERNAADRRPSGAVAGNCPSESTAIDHEEHLDQDRATLDPNGVGSDQSVATLPTHADLGSSDHEMNQDARGEAQGAVQEPRSRPRAAHQSQGQKKKGGWLEPPGTLPPPEFSYGPLQGRSLTEIAEA